MVDQQYNDDNRGSFWPRRAVGGPLKIAGTKFNAEIIQTGREAPAPLYNLYARLAAAPYTLYGCSLFTPKNPESKAQATGLLNIDGAEYWINKFNNDPDPQNPRRPVVGATVMPNQPEPTPQPSPGSEEQPPPSDLPYDNIPF